MRPGARAWSLCLRSWGDSCHPNHCMRTVARAGAGGGEHSLASLALGKKPGGLPEVALDVGPGLGNWGGTACAKAQGLAGPKVGGSQQTRVLAHPSHPHQVGALLQGLRKLLPLGDGGRDGRRGHGCHPLSVQSPCLAHPSAEL